MMFDLDDLADDVLEVVSTAAEHKKKPVARVGKLRFVFRAGTVAVAIALAPITAGATPQSIAVDGVLAATRSVAALERCGVMSEVQRQAATKARRVLRPVGEPREISDPDYGF